MLSQLQCGLRQKQINVLGVVMDRRSFLSSAMLGGVAVAGSGCSLFSPEPRQAIKSWDQVTDVLVVGSGSAGISAAIDARKAGAEVLVLEKFHRLSGSSGMSGGVCYMGGSVRCMSWQLQGDNANKLILAARDD